MPCVCNMITCPECGPGLEARSQHPKPKRVRAPRQPRIPDRVVRLLKRLHATERPDHKSRPLRHADWLEIGAILHEYTESRR